MTIVFRDNIGAYTGKGSPLTRGEVDGNFHDLLLRMIDLETDGPLGISSITATSDGTALIVTLTDNSTQGPFPLPVATFNPAGAWTSNTPYAALDIVEVVGDGFYLVLVGHTSDTTFDPEAEDGSAGDLLYLKIGQAPDGETLFDGGEWATGTVYVENDVVTVAGEGTFIVEQNHTAAATFNPDAQAGGNPIYRRFPAVSFDAPTTVSTTTYTIGLADVGKYLRFTNASGCLVTFPDNVAFTLGDEVHFRQAAAGSVRFIEGGTAVFINPQRDGYDTGTPWKGAAITAKYVANDEWDLIGPHGSEISA